jgi:hypothetical protein
MFAKDMSSKNERRSVIKHYDSCQEYDNVRYDWSPAKVMILPVRWEVEPTVYMDINRPVRDHVLPAQQRGRRA